MSWEEIRSLPIFFDWVRTWRYRLSRAATPTPSRSLATSVRSEVCNTARAFCQFRSVRRLGMSQTRRFGRRLCSRELAPEGLGLHVVGADALAVDLDDGDQLAVTRLQLSVALDRDLDQLEPELIAKLGELGLRPLAKVAALGFVEDDLRRLRRPGTTHLVTDCYLD